MTLEEISVKSLDLVSEGTLQVSDVIKKVYSNIYAVTMSEGIQYQFDFDVTTDRNRNLSFRCEYFHYL